MAASTKHKTRTIDDYLARVSEDKRAALQKLRTAIKAAAPKAQECFSYGLPAFCLNGPLVAFAAMTSHCAFYPLSGSIVEQFKQQLQGFETSKGTIRFQPNKPLPPALIRRIVKARIAEKDS